MRTLLTVYIGLYVLVTLGAIRVESNLGAPRWKLLGGTLAAGLGVFGMIHYHQSAVTVELARVWRWVFPYLVLQAVVDCVWELRHGLGRLRTDPDKPVDPRSVALALGFSLVLLVPFFYVNFRVAFG